MYATFSGRDHFGSIYKVGIIMLRRIIRGQFVKGSWIQIAECRVQ
jgi:hypothetical protein